MFCKYCGIRLKGNETLFCSSCEEMKEELGNTEFFYYSKEEVRAAKRSKPFINRFIVSMLVATVFSYGASFAVDLISAM